MTLGTSRDRSLFTTRSPLRLGELRDPVVVPDDIEAAARRLLDATEGQLGYVTRHPVTGELEVVVAARGSNAHEVLATARRRSRLASLLRSFAGRS